MPRGVAQRRDNEEEIGWTGGIIDKRERDITGNSILAVEIDLKNIENH